MSWVDQQKLLATITPLDVAVRLGLREGKWASGTFACPACGELAAFGRFMPSRLGLNNDDPRLWACGQGHGGDIIQMVVMAKRLSADEAADWLAEEFGQDDDAEDAA